MTWTAMGQLPNSAMELLLKIILRKKKANTKKKVT